ncbi:MAG: FKBP-type peptidyl-prolyl cis-trans isomerase SlyD [Moritella sp.]|jgi:FKBP-type peptidyl-prolyl cis-trans isomerase SlyD
MIIEKKSVVTLHFAVTDDKGELIDDTRDSQPLEFLMGSDYLVPGLEAELEGLTVGNEFDVTVEPEQGYGIYDPLLVQEVPAALFEGVDGVEPGMAFTADTDDGHRTVIVTGVEDDIVIVDANHPFAGRTLQFTGEVLGIREATEEESEAGFIHSAAGGCGCDHDHDNDHQHGGCGDKHEHGGEGCCGGHGDKHEHGGEGCCGSDESAEPKAGGCCGGEGHCH